jgi:hypothetical protein
MYTQYSTGEKASFVVYMASMPRPLSAEVQPTKVSPQPADELQASLS